MKRIWTIALFACISIFGTVIWFGWPKSEPIYQGHPMRYWVEPTQYLLEQNSDAKAAYAEMDERAVDWLVTQLGWKPSFFVEGVNWMGRPFKFVVRDRRDFRYGSAMVLARLGAKASNAVPALRLVVEDRRTAGEVPPAPAARYALSRIQDEPIQTLIDELDPGASDRQWGIASTALAQLKSGAVQAVPNLVLGLSPTNSGIRRFRALNALKSIGDVPQQYVPQLVECMKSPFWTERELAMGLLEKVGPEAVAAGKAAEAASPLTTE